MLPLVGVIIPSYNSARYVSGAVESALAQTYSPIEVVVVDDGSTDNTAQVLSEYRSRIRYIYQPNSGLGSARNRGIRESRADLFAFLDADDLWFREKLQQQVPVLLSNPTVGLVHTDFIYLDDQKGEFFTNKRPRHNLVGRCYTELFLANAIFVSTVLVRRECLENVGLFDEGTFSGTEDYDLWLRIAERYEFSYVPVCLAMYRRHCTNMSHNSLRMKTSEAALINHVAAVNPFVWHTVKRKRIMRRLFGLHFSVGYIYFDRGNWPLARRWLSQALRYYPRSGYAWTLYVSTFVPVSWVKSCRNLKQRFTKLVYRCAVAMGCGQANLESR